MRLSQYDVKSVFGEAVTRFPTPLAMALLPLIFEPCGGLQRGSFDEVETFPE